MSIRLGINPLTWTNDDLPSLGADTPLEVCLSEGRQAGFAGFELGNKFPRTPDALSQVLNAHDLALVSGWYSSRLLERSVEEELEALNDHLQLLKTCGATVMVYCEVSRCVHGDQDTPVSRRPVMNDADWERLTTGLDAVAKEMASQGVEMAYHHHMGTVIESEADVDRLMTSTQHVRLLLDAGHLTYAGGDPVAVARKHGSRITHVHCKDIRMALMDNAINRDKSFLDAVLDGVFTVPGDGGVDFAALFTELKRQGYGQRDDRWLVVEAEQDPAVADPLTYATLGHDNLAHLAQEAGLISA